MITESHMIQFQVETSAGTTSEQSRAERVMLTLFGLLAAYSVVYLFVLAAHFRI